MQNLNSLIIQGYQIKKSTTIGKSHTELNTLVFSMFTSALIYQIARKGLTDLQLTNIIKLTTFLNFKN